MAIVLPLLLVSGTCLECRVAFFLWPGALNQFCTRHTNLQLHTYSLPLCVPPSISLCLTLFLMANRDGTFAHCDPRVRLKTKILTLNLTTFKRERKKILTQNSVERYEPIGSPKKTSRYDSAEDVLGGFSQSSN